MDDDKMIDDIVAMLDRSISAGTGHVNLEVTDEAQLTKNIETLGCSDCSRTPMACSIPTMHQGLDDYSGNADSDQKNR